MSYTKQNFTTGQVLKASHLNYIENGISDNATAIEQLNSDLFFNSTETITYSNVQLLCIGFLTNNAKTIKASIILPKRVPSGANITLNTFKANIRIPNGGYLGTGGTTTSYVSGGTDFLKGNTSGSILYAPGLNTITVPITMSTAFTANNIPLNIELNNFEVTITV